MFTHMSKRQQFGYAGLGALLLFSFGVIGVRHLRKPAPIVFSAPPAVTAAADIEKANPITPEVIVHVAGAVKSPGVVRLHLGSRVVDALHAAGGPTSNADLDSINLAAKLVDGSQLRILPKEAAARSKRASGSVARSRRSIPPFHPSIDKNGYFAPATVAEEYQPKESAAQSIEEPTKSDPPSSRFTKKTVAEVDINSADLQALQGLPGVGPGTAQKILDYRQEHGPFKSADELLAVKGIGAKKLEKMRPYVRI